MKKPCKTDKVIYRKLNEVQMNDFVDELGELNMAGLASHVSAELNFEPNSVEDENVFEIVFKLVERSL